MNTNICQLSFTAPRRDGGLDVWVPATIGQWDADCRAGRRHAAEAIGYMAATNDADLVPAIVRRIAARGEVDGVAVGFFTALAERATAA